MFDANDVLRDDRLVLHDQAFGDNGSASYRRGWNCCTLRFLVEEKPADRKDGNEYSDVQVISRPPNRAAAFAQSVAARATYGGESQRVPSISPPINTIQSCQRLNEFELEGA